MHSKVPFSRRATIYPGRADIREIIQSEATGEYIKRVQAGPEERGKMLVIGKTPCLLRL
jgi:hypothetical protein